MTTLFSPDELPMPLEEPKKHRTDPESLLEGLNPQQRAAGERGRLITDGF